MYIKSLNICVIVFCQMSNFYKKFGVVYKMHNISCVKITSYIDNCHIKPQLYLNIGYETKLKDMPADISVDLYNQ